MYLFYTERWIIVPNLKLLYCSCSDDFFLSLNIYAVLCSSMHVHMYQTIYGQYSNTTFTFFNLSFINILGSTSPLSISLFLPLLGSTSPLSISLVQPLLYQYPWLNLSFINFLGSTSPLSISLVQPLLYQYPWFNLSFINILGSTSPLLISLVQPLLY